MARRDLAGDGSGQMMILAAVLLVIGLIALAGMVARVNQLGSQTAVESDKAILGEIPPLADAIESAVSNLTTTRTVTGIAITSGSTTITFSATPQKFSSADVGLAIVGNGIAVGTRITAVPSTTSATLSAAATSTVASGSVAVGPFALTSTTTPTVEAAVISILEHLQRIEASHGFAMDYEITCTGGSGGSTANGRVVAHLSDGTVWVEMRSTTVFTRTTSCTSVYG